MLTPLVLTQLLCAAVLALSGIAKLREPRASRDAFVALRLPDRLAAGAAPLLLPYAELVLAAGLLVTRGRLLAVVAGATGLLFVAYLVVIARALRFTEPVHCNCFGKIGDHSVSIRTLIRNVLLVLAAGAALLGALGGVAVIPVLTGPGAGSVWGWVAVAVLVAAVAVLILGRPAPEPEPVVEAAPVDERVPVAEAAPVERRLPDEVVTDSRTGALVRLRELGADGPMVLVTLTSGCGPCQRVAAQLPGWRAAGLPVRALVRLGATRLFPDPGGLAALEDHTGRVIPLVFGYHAPAAYLVGADGVLLAGPARGEDAVAALVGSLGEGPAYDPFRLPEDEPSEVGEEDYFRAPIPDVVLIDRDRQPTTLRSLAMLRAQLLVTVNCYCGPAMFTLARVADYRDRLPALDVRVLSSVDLARVPNLDPGVLASSVYDHDQIAHRALGITSSPAAVLIGADGLLAGGPVLGPEEVDAFIAEVEAQFAAAAD
ncbi:MauE/DoxX family redox-associated membrane protein [Granulicoccus phenolivorans]|uniref:MauE/DoxX family redox-associated membrane protein n=1 Tax=Granulicoccus phenolivorans TaxID=266854 RepID=UPI0003FC364E|nr:MauE/DoxX family redox-associated membrane protein [Granulicoccus phenolivorans]